MNEITTQNSTEIAVLGGLHKKPSITQKASPTA